MKRRTFLMTTAAAAALLPLAANAASHMDEKIAPLYEAAKPEGEITWYVVPMDSETAERVGQKFTELYPGIKVNVVRSTATVAFQKLNQDIDSGVANCDVLTTSNVAHAEDLKSRDLLLKYAPMRKGEALAAFQGADPDDFYHITTAGPMGIVYNTDLVSEAEAPKNWPDLLDPKWKGKLAIGHPGFSGYVGIWAVKMEELYGWDYFDKLLEQDPYIGRSSIDVVTTTAAGETAVGAGPMTSALISAEKGNPMATIVPTDGMVIITSPSCILKNAPHPEAAKLFMEFLLGKEIAELTVDQFSTPIRGDVTPREGVAPLTEDNVITATKEQIIDGVSVTAEKFRDTFGI
ncbi:ABC transporter substrate-binding protein [Primorskyibacter flagellatus]|uniref:ABC transporter substrate-binding protein n=1 Tax=Primorskyibacter flagellatus TaxID=1387277 RepID=A0A917ADX3_9RHOB|nr:extracellular solute-binding protein [Primorskyibacter flagellatus]GGE45087.1 ABC transporter substrate-binding protein [Primorskyibacter flagellatus]